MKKILLITTLIFGFAQAEYLFIGKIKTDFKIPTLNCELPSEIGKVSTEYCGALNKEVFYAGIVDNRYIYLSTDNEGVVNWTTNTINKNTLINANSYIDGKYNSDLARSISETDYIAINRCYDKGEDWYLPSLDEIMLVVSNSASLNYLNLNIINGWYWSSTEANATAAKDIAIHFGIFDHNSTKYASSPVGNVKCALSYEI